MEFWYHHPWICWSNLIIKDGCMEFRYHYPWICWSNLIIKDGRLYIYKHDWATIMWNTSLCAWLHHPGRHRDLFTISRISWSDLHINLLSCFPVYRYNRNQTIVGESLICEIGVIGGFLFLWIADCDHCWLLQQAGQQCMLVSLLIGHCPIASWSANHLTAGWQVSGRWSTNQQWYT